jgi:hypothetical protein
LPQQRNNKLIHAVKLEEDTGRKVVQVYFKRYENTSLSDIFFRLDSGADITTISKEDLKLLGYSANWIEKNKKEAADIKIKLADGTERNGVYVEIPMMYFMEKDFYNFKVFIVPEDGFDYSNLLGLDVSTEFTYLTENETGVLEFYRIESSKFTASNYTSQQRIGEVNKP